MNDKMTENAMSIILKAGDARVHCMDAFDAISQMDFVKAKIEIKRACKDITMAHQIQTEEIQHGINSGNQSYSLLFAHAQDTLMTIYSEINIAKKMIKIWETYDTRIKELEEKIGQ